METLEEIRLKIESNTRRIARHANQGIGFAKAGNGKDSLECIDAAVKVCHECQQAIAEAKACIEVNVSVKNDKDMDGFF